MARFVILRHDGPRGVHFDFMLEWEGVLKTWALPEAPSTGVSLLGESLPDHRLAYLDYEGPVSNNRGSVTRWDCGDYTIEEHTEDRWAITLAGEILRGKLRISQRSDSLERWQFDISHCHLDAN